MIALAIHWCIQLWNRTIQYTELLTMVPTYQCAVLFISACVHVEQLFYYLSATTLHFSVDAATESLAAYIQPTRNIPQNLQILYITNNAECTWTSNQLTTIKSATQRTKIVSGIYKQLFWNSVIKQSAGFGFNIFTVNSDHLKKSWRVSIYAYNEILATVKYIHTTQWDKYTWHIKGRSASNMPA